MSGCSHLRRSLRARGMCGSSPCTGGNKGKSQQCCHGGVSSLGSLLLTQMSPVMLSSCWALLFGNYSKVFDTEG